ncbi:MAG: DUF3047 domain-containing protein [Desulfobacterales bacterium]|nr:DUF3047 domain-containing protein [Desulfobacterales bacterium]
MKFHSLLKWRVVFTFGILLLVCPEVSELLAKTGDILEIGKFSAAKVGGDFPPGWEPLVFKKIKQHTKYELVNDGGEVVIKAESKSSSSGLIKKIRINPEKYPVVSWRWKVTNIYAKSDIAKKEGDDYPARLYITFEYDPAKLPFSQRVKFNVAKILYGEYPPLGAINYIWEGKETEGTMVPNSYTNRVMMIVVESGQTKLNTWVQEERNILEDFKKAFGESPPVISGVAIMTDTDDTNESAITYYGDIIFKRK